MGEDEDANDDIDADWLALIEQQTGVPAVVEEDGSVTIDFAGISTEYGFGNRLPVHRTLRLINVGVNNPAQGLRVDVELTALVIECDPRLEKVEFVGHGSGAIANVEVRNARTEGRLVVRSIAPTIERLALVNGAYETDADRVTESLALRDALLDTRGANIRMQVLELAGHIEIADRVPSGDVTRAENETELNVRGINDVVVHDLEVDADEPIFSVNGGAVSFDLVPTGAQLRLNCPVVRFNEVAGAEPHTNLTIQGTVSNDMTFAHPVDGLSLSGQPIGIEASVPEREWTSSAAVCQGRHSPFL